MYYAIVCEDVPNSLPLRASARPAHLERLKALADELSVAWVSDHLCWTGIGGHNSHDLLPLPYTEEAIAHVADRISRVQDFLGRQILVENLSSYVTFTASEMTEWAFYSEIAERADCLMLLDINNVYVSACNHEFSPLDYLRGVPAERVWQHHLAGHSYDRSGNIIIDTHDHPVRDEVWDLYRASVELFGPVSTMIERDDDIPEFAELFAEMQHARAIAEPLIGQNVA